MVLLTGVMRTRFRKKVRRLALKHALSSKYKDKTLIIIENESVQSEKTKNVTSIFNRLGIDKALIITGRECNPKLKRASANLDKINILPVIGINVYDILRHKILILTCEAVKELEGRLA